MFPSRVISFPFFNVWLDPFFQHKKWSPDQSTSWWWWWWSTTRWESVEKDSCLTGRATVSVSSSIHLGWMNCYSFSLTWRLLTSSVIIWSPGSMIYIWSVSSFTSSSSDTDNHDFVLFFGYNHHQERKS